MTRERWEKIKEIFNKVLEKPPAERSSAIAQLCAADASLGLEVESLLAGIEGAENFMPQPAIAMVASEFGATTRAFEIGETISSRFKILRFIGEGGMGEVYEAEDLEIGASIAIKTIRSQIASTPGMLARFRREIQVTRLVTHPNVCRTFDVAYFRVPANPSAAAREVIYLTMELLQGEILSERLRRGPMPVNEAEPLVRQIASGLKAAHAAGVIHRDFKPGNVILCPPTGLNPEERAVITDFGLAQTWSVDDTISNSFTRSGQIVGSLAYMAPEQLEGRPVTPATDIYAFGLVMYEMVTGQKAYTADTVVGAAVQRLNGPPRSPRSIVPGLNKNWEGAILRCLQVQPADRFQDVEEICDALVEGPPHPLKSLNRTRGRFFRIGLGLTALLLLLIGAWSLRSTISGWFSPSSPPTSLDFIKFTEDAGVTANPSISLDGSLVVYSSDRAGDGILNIWVQREAGGQSRQVTFESSHVLEPGCSPDGSLIAFRSAGDGRIYEISSLGGTKRLIAQSGHHPTFSPDGQRILYWSGDWTADPSRPSFRATGKIFVVKASGGIPKQLAGDFADARLPTWSSDGRHVLFQGTRNPVGSVMESSDWWVLDLDHPETVPVPTGAFKLFRDNSIVLYESVPQWRGDTLILSGRVGETTDLFRLLLSPETGQPRGKPQRLTRTLGTTGQFNPSVSNKGQVLTESSNATIHIWSLPFGVTYPASEADLVPLTAEESQDARPSISKDGKILAFSRMSPSPNRSPSLWRKDLAGGSTMRLTTYGVAQPIISHDGAQVAYALYEAGNWPIEVVANGALGPQRVCQDCGQPLDWSSDDSSILYDAEQSHAIYLFDLKSGKKTELARRPNLLTAASLGPGSQYLLFAEWLDAEHSRLWLAPMHEGVAAPMAEWVSLTSGRFGDDKPRASVDGRSIFFESNQDGFRCLWMVRLASDFKSTRGMPTPVFHMHKAGFGLSILSKETFNLRVADDKLVFNAVSKKSNIWTAQLPTM